MSSPTKELRAKLDESRVEWWPSDDPQCEDIITHWRVGPFQWTAIEGEKGLWLNAGIAGHEPLTPEQAIAATVGAGTLTAEQVRKCAKGVYFEGYSDGATHRANGIEETDWQAIADKLNATVGERDTMGLWPEWEQVLFANVSDEVAQDNLNECVHELLDKAATVGRSCASCPEMDNPDSYIMHLHRALEVADRGAGTCHSTSKWTNVFKCSVCGFEYDFVTDPYQGPRYCPNCGKKVMSE